MRPPSPEVARRRRAVAFVVLVAVVIALVSLLRSGGAMPPRGTAPPAGGVPPPTHGVYAYARAGMLSPAVRGDPGRLYVPESAGAGIDLIDPSTRRVVARYMTGLDPQHVVPAYDLRTLYVTNDLANTLTPTCSSTAGRF